MKVFISADIEGITGVTDWNETELGHAEYEAARQQMTAEVAAACEGALYAGASEVWVKDSHDSARNLIAARLPKETRLVRGWSGHPFMMLQGLDDTFQAVMQVGYHSGAGAGRSPLEHTLTGNVWRIHLNGRSVSEFYIDACTAAYVGVPLVFISGDQGICDEAGTLNPHITTVAVKQGIGNATVSIHPDVAVSRIRDGVAQALSGELNLCRLNLPGKFTLQIEYRRQAHATQWSYFPGVQRVDATTIQLETTDYFDVLRLLSFAT
jgi:D-amino peptidase